MRKARAVKGEAREFESRAWLRPHTLEECYLKRFLMRVAARGMEGSCGSKSKEEEESELEDAAESGAVLRLCEDMHCCCDGD